MACQMTHKMLCFVCDAEVFPWALMRVHGELVCRPCINYEGNYRLFYTINNTREMKRRACGQLSVRFEPSPRAHRHNSVRVNHARADQGIFNIPNPETNHTNDGQVSTSTVNNRRRRSNSPPVLVPETPIAPDSEVPEIVECTPDFPMPTLNPIPDWFPRPSVPPTATVTSDSNVVDPVVNSIDNFLATTRERGTNSRTRVRQFIRIKPLPNTVIRKSANSNSD